MNVEADVLLVAIAIMAMASTLQASVGFGANLLAAPTVAMLDPAFVPGPLFIATAALTVATALRERHDVDQKVVGWATAGRLPGSVVGAIVLATATDRSIQLMVGISILVAVFLSSGVIHVGERRRTYFGAGVVSGFGSTTASIGGPPLALALQHRSGAALRATMGAYFAIGTVITLPAIAAAGRLGREEILVGAALIPGSLAGFAISGPLRPRVDAGRVRPLVLGLAAVAAVVLIVRTW